DRFAVSPAFVRRLMQRYRETGSLAPSTARRGPAPRLAGRADDLRRLAADYPGLTPAQYRDRLRARVSALTRWRMPGRLGLTFKKSPSRPPSGAARTSPGGGPSGGAGGCPGRAPAGGGGWARRGARPTQTGPPGAPPPGGGGGAPPPPGARAPPPSPRAA